MIARKKETKVDGDKHIDRYINTTWKRGNPGTFDYSIESSTFHIIGII